MSRFFFNKYLLYYHRILESYVTIFKELQIELIFFYPEKIAKYFSENNIIIQDLESQNYESSTEMSIFLNRVVQRIIICK